MGSIEGLSIGELGGCLDERKRGVVLFAFFTRRNPALKWTVECAVLGMLRHGFE